MRASTTSRWVVAAALILGTLALPQAARAQAPSASFGDLKNLLRPGDKVFVREIEGNQIAGRVTDLSATTLGLESGGRYVDLPAARVGTIVRQRPDSLKNGLFIGLGVGLGTAGILMAAGSAGPEQCPVMYKAACTPAEWSASGVLAALGFFGGVGAAAGIGIDALIPGRKVLVYAAPGAPAAARVIVSPILSPKRQGIAVRVVF